MINKKGAAISQIGILILAVVAFAVVLNESSLASATDNVDTRCTFDDCTKYVKTLTSDCTPCLGMVTTNNGAYVKNNCKWGTDICDYDNGWKCENHVCVKSEITTVTDEHDCSITGICVVPGQVCIDKKCVTESFYEENPGLFQSFSTSNLYTNIQTGLGFTNTFNQFKDKLTKKDKPKINTPDKDKTKIGKVYDKLTGGPVRALLTYTAIAIASGLISKQIALQFGASDEQANAIGTAVGIGTFVGLALTSENLFGKESGAVAGKAGPYIGVGIAAALIIMTVKKESTDIAKYQCFAFVPDYGGEHCEECNNRALPCTEYQCKSLGQSCEVVNPGTTEELCTFVGRGDVEPPIISAWETPLPEGYIYNPIETTSTDRGVQVINPLNKEGCVPSFTDVAFGVTLNEPSICKISYERDPNFEEMGNEFFSRGVSRYNHSMHMTFPDNAAIEAEGGEYQEGFNEMFVRCKDARGNENVENFVFKFCVDDSPDIAAPVILDMNPLDDSPIAFNRSTVDTTFYLNKPADCKWDRLDMDYEQMGNEMDCAESVSEAINYGYRMVYPCYTTLSGLQNYQENKFYVKCKSYPLKPVSEQVVMEESYEYNLFGSRDLVITSAEPNNETISGSSDQIEVTLQVETFGGASEGNALCSFSSSGNDGTQTLMFNTDSNVHSQQLTLSPGEYTYYIKCADRAGNLDTEEMTFTAESDTVSPLIARVYNQDGYLRIVTNEAASCVYSVADCTYEFIDGFQIDKESPTIHYTQWNTDTTLYVKCEDDFKNQPLAVDECSLIVRPYDEFVESAA